MPRSRGSTSPPATSSARRTCPKQGTSAPWKLYQNYIHDLLTLRYGKVDDGAMVFSNPQPAASALPATARLVQAGAACRSTAR